MSEELPKCPICGSIYRSNSHRFLDPKLCPHHEDIVWRTKYNDLLAKHDALKEHDALQTKLEKAKETLKTVRRVTKDDTLFTIVSNTIVELEATNE